MNIIKSDLLSKIDFIEHGFFDRTGGFSTGESFDSLNVGINRGDNDDAVIQNRSKISDTFGIPVSNMIILNQVHGNIVHVITEDNLPNYKFSNVENALKNEGDAIITNIPDILIGINTADCVPILVVDNISKYIAVIHAGWKGAVNNVIESTINKMQELGCRDLYFAMGPCIQKKSFEVGQDVSRHVDRKYISIINGKMYFDLQLYVLEKIMKLGAISVSKMNIDTCTDQRFFSYRRQNGVCGVQFSGIILKNNK